MTEQIIEVEADSLDEARAQIKAQTPDGLSILSEKVISDGKPKTIRAVADETEAAFVKAQTQLPDNASVLQKNEITAAGQKTVTVEAFDEQSAKVLVRSQIGNDATMRDLKLTIPGKQGFLGVGKKPHQFQAEIFQQAVVEITYKIKAKISVEVGKEQKTVATVMRDFVLTKEAEIEEAGGFEVWDLLRDLVNSGFSKEQIAKAHQHRSSKVRSLAQEFLSEVEKLQTVSNKHAIIQSGNTRITVAESVLKKELEEQIAFILDLTKENIEELLHTGKTETVSFLGQTKVVTMEYCECADISSHIQT